MFGMQKLQLYALVGAAFVLGLIGIYSTGVARGQDKIKRKIDEKRLSNLNTQKEIKDEVKTLDDTELSERASTWVRKDNR
tara:strand:- start:4371 stop:4610 length:240 start_codon:yes stop_codon:yes gene_type:complete